jgi:hypothetical protein
VAPNAEEALHRLLNCPQKFEDYARQLGDHEARIKGAEEDVNAAFTLVRDNMEKTEGMVEKSTKAMIDLSDKVSKSVMVVVIIGLFLQGLGVIGTMLLKYWGII